MKPIERVQILIKDEGISISAFEKKVGMSNNSIQTAIKRNANLKDDTLNSILKAYKNINPEWLLTGVGSKFRAENLGSKMGSNVGSNLEKSIISEPQIEYIPVPVDKHGNENIIVVDIKSAAGFGAIVDNEKALKEYPTIALPGFLYRGRTQYVAFEIDGDSLHPTVQHKDYIISSRINGPNDIRSGNVYTILSEGCATTKRVYYSPGDDYIECVSDNELYEPYKQYLREITAFFKGEGILRTQFRNWNNDIRREVSILRRDIDKIKRKLDL